MVINILCEARFVAPLIFDSSIKYLVAKKTKIKPIIALINTKI